MAKPPFPWIGGKEKIAPYILQLFPPKLKQYVEPFGGSGAVLLALPPDPNRLDIYNDLDAELVNLYSCIKERSNVLLRELKFLPIHGRKLFEYYRDFVAHKEVYFQNVQAEIECLGDRSCFTEEQAGELLPIFQERLALFDVKRAAAYYLAIRGSFSATVTSFGVKGMDVEHLLKMFPPVSARLKDVPLENKNALQLIRERDRKEGLIYADPPYVKTERLYRIAGKLGRFRRFHVRLWQILSGCEGYVVLSYNDCPFINQRNEGIDLDGVSGALMATQNLQMQTFITNPSSSQNGPQTQIAFAANQRDEVRDLHDVAGALGAQPGMKQQTFVAGFSAGAGASAGTIGYQEDVAPTLKGSPSGNCMPSILCINDQGGQIMECSENVTGTLRAQEHGHQPLVLRPTGPKVYENHGIDGRYTGPHDVAPTMSARYGTGGNNIPLVQQEEVICIAGNAIDRQPQNGGNGFGWQRDISYTLTTSDRHSVYARQRVDQFKDDEIASTESARQHKDATDLVCQPTSTWDADCRNLIRRLTPLECERLQGYPDGWTDVPGASDSARYKALGNSVAIPCVEYLMQRVAMVITLDLEWDF